MLLCLDKICLCSLMVVLIGLRALALHCEDLVGIDVGHTDVTHEGLAVLCENCHKLEDVRLLGCEKVSTDNRPKCNFFQLLVQHLAETVVVSGVYLFIGKKIILSHPW